MDRSNHMQQVRRSLEEVEEMVSKQKADRHEMVLDMQQDRVEGDIRREQRCEYDKHISDQRAQIDRAVETKGVFWNRDFKKIPGTF